MTKTEGEKREYTRGYNRGWARTRDYAAKAFNLAKAYRDRLATSTAQKCSTCRRWTRGCETCAWGRCAADFESVVEPWMKAETFVGEKTERGIYTNENFACVNWLPRKASP